MTVRAKTYIIGISSFSAITLVFFFIVYNFSTITKAIILFVTFLIIPRLLRYYWLYRHRRALLQKYPKPQTDNEVDRLKWENQLFDDNTKHMKGIFAGSYLLVTIQIVLLLFWGFILFR